MVTKLLLRDTPRGQSLLIALAVVVLYAAGCFLVYLLNGINQFLLQGAIGLVIFVGTYFIVNTVFGKYVEKRINPIFRTIHTATLSQRDLRRKINTGEIIAELDNEVKVWTKNQKAEIKKLKQMEKYRKDFLGNVSHEMKTPIFNIQGYVLTLLDGGLEDKRINKLYLQRTETSINRLITIVDDLESISRLESGEFKLRYEKFNIVKLVEEIFETDEMLAKMFNIKLELDGNYSSSIRVKGDRARLSEAIGNLIGNSIKYGKNNGKTKVKFTEEGNHIMVEIKDNGIGINQEDLPRIFERFFRVDKSRSRDSGGTGLGLSIVKHVIQAHKQTIDVSSIPGKGTVFVFSLQKA
jgi:two-component system, OmpR family, phosphate regulon sensor histidine kinase PhoR